MFKQQLGSGDKDPEEAGLPSEIFSFIRQAHSLHKVAP